MADARTGSSRRRWRLVFLLFLFVYLPLDALDADMSDTFEGSVIQVRIQAGEDAVSSLPHPAVILLDVPDPVTVLRALAPLPKPTCGLLITRRSFGLPRSDGPHVAFLLPSSPPLVL